jgi:Tol biopolymer transport system component
MKSPRLLLCASLLAAPLAAGALHDPREVHLADVRQLTFGGDNAEAYWSFDGRHLSFQSTRPPFACDQIFTLSPFEGGEPRLVSSGKGRTTCAHFLLGDERLIWAATDAYAEACPTPPDMSQGYVWPIDMDYELFVANPDGGDKARLTENRAYDAEATVCAVDGSIVFTSTRDGDLDLYRMDADGSNVKRLTSTPGYDGGAFFSRDCRQIVWRASRPTGEALAEYQRLLAQGLVRPSKLELWVADRDGGNARQITDLGAAAFAPFFFPDGQRVIFSTNYGDPRGREFDLWAVDVDGSDLERITWTADFDGFPMFSPDGQWLVFASNRNPSKPRETDLFLARWVDAPRGRSVESAADRFAADAAWLADDAREGRGVGLPGLAAAGEWIEGRFRELGLAPAGANGGYRQKFDVEVKVESGPGSALAIDGAAVDAELFRPTAFSTAGPVEAEVVYAGWGITAPEKGRDDYAGLDVKGKIVLVRRFVPPSEAFAGTDNERRWGDLRYKAFNAREQGAIGLLVADLAPETPSDDPHAGAEAPLPRLVSDTSGDVGIPVVVLKRDAATPLLAGGGRARIAVDLVRERAPAFNVVGRLEPAKPPVDDRVVVIGAHYDHLGRGGANSLEPGSTEVHNGADDNASGVAALLEAARALAARRDELTRPVVFAAFSGEELGLIGSSTLVKSPPPGLEPARIAAMVNLDMVGRLRDETLTVFGVDTAAEWKELVPAACGRARLVCKQNGDGYGPSDHTSYFAADVPVLFLFSGTHDQYHRPSDDAATLNATGGAKVAALAADLGFEIAAFAAPPAVVKAAAPPLPRGDVRSFGASLGTIPDYSGPPPGKTGMPLSGVRPGGPADKAGLKRGDLIVGLAGKEIRSIEDLMFVLRQAQPGDAVTVVIERDGERLELPIVFGEASRRN